MAQLLTNMVELNLLLYRMIKVLSRTILNFSSNLQLGISITSNKEAQANNEKTFHLSKRQEVQKLLVIKTSKTPFLRFKKTYKIIKIDSIKIQTKH